MLGSIQVIQPRKIPHRKDHRSPNQNINLQKKEDLSQEGTVALREIKKYQRSTSLLLPRAPFQRLVRSVCANIDNSIRF